MSESKHDQVARQIARREKTEYNRGPGADIQTSRRVIEIETPETIGDAARQLQGYKKPVYVVPTDTKAISDAIKHYKNTTIGVMTTSGKIVKSSTRGAKTTGTGPRNR
jgi:hypothetical protein